MRRTTLREYLTPVHAVHAKDGHNNQPAPLRISTAPSQPIRSTQYDKPMNATATATRTRGRRCCQIPIIAPHQQSTAATVHDNAENHKPISFAGKSTCTAPISIPP